MSEQESQHRNDYTLQFAARWLKPLTAFQGSPDTELVAFDVPSWGVHAIRERDGGVVLYAGDRTAFIVIRDEKTALKGDLPEGQSLYLDLPDELVQACHAEPVRMRSAEGDLAEFEPPGWMTPTHVLVMAFDVDDVDGTRDGVSYAVFGDGCPPGVTEEQQEYLSFALAKGRNAHAALFPTWLPNYLRILERHEEAPIPGMHIQTAYLNRLSTVSWCARLSFSDHLGPVVVTWTDAPEAVAVLMPMSDPSIERDEPPEPWLSEEEAPEPWLREVVPNA